MDGRAAGDRLDATVLRAAITHPAWRRIDIVADTGSTNADLLARSSAGEDIAGAVLLAESQSAGRGRHGRNWVTPPGTQIAMSVGVDVAGIGPDRWGWLPLLTGVALVDTLAAACGVDTRLKWPNDVLVGSDKLAGVLAEVASPAPTIVVGLGLNVSSTADQLPTPTSTSLRMAGVSAPDRNRLVVALLGQLGTLIERWRRHNGRDPMLEDDYRRCSATIGTTVRATLPGGTDIVGTALGVDHMGRLRVDDGAIVQVVSAGDITHLRAT